MQPEFDLFISYSSRDKQIADALLAGLEADRIRCWIAPRNVQPGKSWAGSILRGIRDADVFMLVLTEQSNQSNQVLNEVERAINRQKPIICYRAENVILSDDLELFLSSKHWVEASGQPVGATLPMLTAAIRPLLAHRQAVAQPSSDEHTTPEEREEFLRNGKRAYLAQDFTLAGDYFNESAEAGSGEALFYVGEMNRKGEGTKRTPAKARQLYKSAIEKGSALGNWGLARMLDEADELPDRARQYYEQAREAIAEKAVEEDAYCCYLYALMYDEGKGMNKDQQRAERWLEKARDNGYKLVNEPVAPKPKAPPNTAKSIIPGTTPDQPADVGNVPQSIPVPAAKDTESANVLSASEPVPFVKIPADATSTTPDQPTTVRREVAPKPASDTQSPWKGVLIGLAVVGTITMGVEWCEERKADEQKTPYTETDSTMVMDTTMMAIDSTTVTDSNVSYSDKSATELLPLAEAGDVDAQFWLGAKYYNGKGVTQDYQLSIKWFRKSAEQGDKYAQGWLGTIYNYGKGVPENPQQAIEWYRKAADQGNASAQASLGIMYQEGRGVKQSYVEAVKWFRKSAEQGDDGGQYNLGTAYEYGKGVPKDIAEAKRLYRLAAAQDYENAKSALNRLDGQ